MIAMKPFTVRLTSGKNVLSLYFHLIENIHVSRSAGIRCVSLAFSKKLNPREMLFQCSASRQAGARVRSHCHQRFCILQIAFGSACPRRAASRRPPGGSRRGGWLTAPLSLPLGRSPLDCPHLAGTLGDGDGSATASHWSRCSRHCMDRVAALPPIKLASVGTSAGPFCHRVVLPAAAGRSAASAASAVQLGAASPSAFGLPDRVGWRLAPFAFQLQQSDTLAGWPLGQSANARGAGSAATLCHSFPY